MGKGIVVFLCPEAVIAVIIRSISPNKDFNFVS